MLKNNQSSFEERITQNFSPERKQMLSDAEKIFYAEHPEISKEKTLEELIMESIREWLEMRNKSKTEEKR